MGKEKEAACPCCGGSIEDFPDQDGACDYYCTHCGWHEREPSSENLAAALTLREARHPGPFLNGEYLIVSLSSKGVPGATVQPAVSQCVIDDAKKEKRNVL